MHALFEESGKFLAGRILSEADTSAQVELDSGKRVKVKSANILLKFDKPAPAELMAQAQAQAAEIDLDLAWEFAPEEEFGFADLARDYFSDKATLAERPARCSASTRRRTTSAAPAGAASRRPRPRSCSRPWPA
jgi:exoribonuclease-2